MDPQTRDKLIGSTKVRFDALKDSPIVESVIGMSDPGRCMNAKQMIRDNAIVLVDMSTYGSLGVPQRNTIANFYLSELFFTIVSMPPSEWEKHMVLIVCDEFPVFANAKATAKLITEYIPQIRKMNVRFCSLFQGTHPFEGGKDSQLLRTLISNCSSLIFGHKDTVDCKFWGEQLALPELDPTREKYREYEDQQYVVGTRIVTTTNYSVMFSQSESESENAGGSASFDQSESLQQGRTSGRTTGTNESETHTDNQSNTDTENEATTRTDTRSHADNVRESFHNAHAQMRGAVDATSAGNSEQKGSSKAVTSGSSDAKQKGRSEQSSLQVSENKNVGSSYSNATNWARSRSISRTKQDSYTYSQSLTPVYAWRKVVKFLELLSFDDQEKLAARDVASLDVGTCFCYEARQLPMYLEVSFPEELRSETSIIYQENLALLKDRLTTLPCYEQGEKILEYRETWMKLAVQELAKLANTAGPQQFLSLNPLDDPENEV